MHFDFSLNQLAYFTKTAELGSMTRAANQLFVAQSAISTSISQLEQSVGEKLLVRQRSRGVVLTEQGRKFYSAAVKVLRSAEDASLSLRPGEVSGSLTAGCFTTLSQFWVPPLFERAADIYPDLELDIRECSADELTRYITTREMEVALAYDFDYGPDVEFTSVGVLSLYAGVSEHSHFAGRSEVSLLELVEEPLILLNLGKSSNYFLSVFRELGLTPNVSFRFQSFEAVRSMAARGHGYTILNQQPVHGLTNEGLRLVPVPISDPVGGLGVGVLSRKGEGLSAKAEAFVEVCRSVIGKV